MFLIVLEICLALLPLASYYLLKLLIDHSVEHQLFLDNQQLLLIALYAGVLICLAISTSIHRVVDTGFQLKLQDAISSLVIKKSSQLPYEYFEDSKYFNSLHFVQKESVYKPTMVAKSMRGFLSQALMLSSISVLFATLHWSIGFLLVLISIPAGLVKFFYAKKLYHWKIKSTELQRKSMYYNRILTSIHYAKEVRLFNLGNKFTNIYSSLRKQLFKENLGLVRREGTASVAVEIFERGVIIGLILLLLYRGSTGSITVGSIVMYIQAMQKGQSTVKSFISSLSSVYNHGLYIKKLFEFLDLKLSGNRIEPLRTHQNRDIEDNTLSIEKLDFSYPGTSAIVLKDINATFKSGEVIAIVGENGSGKSTLVKLISGLFKPTQGKIRFNSRDVNEYKKDEWYKKVSIIFQDFERYDSTLEENISMHQHLQNHAYKIQESLTMSKSESIVEKLPQGINTKLGKIFNQGVELSQGQWQRIAIARALYKNSDIIILDEPSSAIDPLSEAKIFENLKNIAQNKILILVTHRIYNLTMADKILVFYQGQLLEVGSHKELINKKGKYYEMFLKQSRS